MTEPTHLEETDFEKHFPAGLDEFPTPVNEQHYIDAWLLNTLFDSILELEQYLIAWKHNIEAGAGADIVGEEGSLEIPIPAALYPAYKFCMAWDSNLLEENIKIGIPLFGVTGTLAAAPFIEAITYAFPLNSTSTITTSVTYA